MGMPAQHKSDGKRVQLLSFRFLDNREEASHMPVANDLDKGIRHGYFMDKQEMLGRLQAATRQPSGGRWHQGLDVA